MKRVRTLAQQLNPEVIHSYTFHTNLAAYWAALGTKSIALGSLRGEFTSAKQHAGRWLGRLCARWPRCQITNSFVAAENLRNSRKFFRPNQTYFVRNALDLQRFSNSSGNATHHAFIVGVGSLLQYKRWDRVIRIVKEVSRRRDDCNVLIVGEGPERGRLEAEARRLGVSHRIRFIGATTDVPGLLNKARFLVHTSDTEGCPNAVMEAMASGRPVIAMAAGDISHMIEHGKTGFVVPCGDESTFAQHVLRLLSDDELCFRMGVAAREKAERDFGLRRLVKETFDAYIAAGWKN